MTLAAFAGARRYIGKGVLILLLLSFFGCATAPKPVTIRHESTLSRSDAAIPAQQHRKEPADQSVAELVALLKSKNMISAEEAAQFTGQPVTLTTAGKERIEKKTASITGEINKNLQEQVRSEDKGTTTAGKGKDETAAAGPEWAERVRFGGDIRLRAESDRLNKDTAAVAQPADAVANKQENLPSQNITSVSVQQHRKGAGEQSVAELVALLKSKNVISDDEASRFSVQSTATAGAKSAAVLAEESEQERIDKITARAVELAMKNIQDQVKQQVREELDKEIKVREKEQIDAITANVTEEIKKSLPEQVKSDELNQKVSYVEQKVAELLYGGKVAELAAAAPESSKRIRFGGDIRLRYEHDRFDKNNYNQLPKTSQGSFILEPQNTWANQDFFKYRVRAGAEADIAENLAGNAKMQAAVRLSTGNTTNPVSTNDTLGDYINKDDIIFDQAYLKFMWKTLANAPTVYTVYGGRMPNLWFSTDLVWDSDLNFEGLALNVKKPLTDTESWISFLTAGAFPLQQSEPASIFDSSQHRKWLYAGQIGLERKDRTGISAKIGAAYYYFDNITGVRNPDPLRPGATDWSAPLFQQKGNALFLIDFPNSFKEGLASEFKELNLTGTLDIGYWDPVHIVLLGDYVKNLGFKRSDVAQRIPDPDYPNTSTGYQIGMSVGRPAIATFEQWKPSWKLFLHYKYLEADAVVDAFTDSDFHLGGTNAKGWILGAEYGLMKNTWLTLRWLTADEISGPPLAIDVLQVDLNVKF